MGWFDAGISYRPIEKRTTREGEEKKNQTSASVLNTGNYSRKYEIPA